jgi:hypothetical protein
MKTPMMLQHSILSELSEVVGRTMQWSDVSKWQSGTLLEAKDGEVRYYLPKMAVSVCVKKRTIKRENDK